MARYQIRSRALVDLVNEIKTGRLILSPYFQRNLVWRKMHKQDFIETIILQYPFPQIFIARGEIDVERLAATSLIVDGQQRMSTIREFVDNQLDVDGRYFSDFTPSEKESFLKYEVPVIDLDLSGTDPQIKTIFQRLNRTFYSLSEIEKLATEYATSEFMLMAKFISKEIREVRRDPAIEGDDDDLDDAKDRYVHDPNIPPDFWNWALPNKVVNIQKLIVDSGIFTPYEISRKVHLMFSLNVLATIVGTAFFSRNSVSREYLESFKEAVPGRDGIITGLESVGTFVRRMRLPERSYWRNKANMFSIIVCCYWHRDIIGGLDALAVRRRLEEFFQILPADYQIAAKEAVNRKRERILRDEHLRKVMFGFQ